MLPRHNEHALRHMARLLKADVISSEALSLDERCGSAAR
jgi:hypothetical protein